MQPVYWFVKLTKIADDVKVYLTGKNAEWDAILCFTDERPNLNVQVTLAFGSTHIHSKKKGFGRERHLRDKHLNEFGSVPEYGQISRSYETDRGDAVRTGISYNGLIDVYSDGIIRALDNKEDHGGNGILIIFMEFFPPNIENLFDEVITRVKSNNTIRTFQETYGHLEKCRDPAGSR